MRCLKRLGVERTRMIDIAEEAGISRRTMYRLFATKEAVLEAIASARIVKLATEQLPTFAKFTTLREALVEGTLLGMKKGRTDTLVRDIFVEGSDHKLDQFYFAGSEEIRHHMLVLWTPILDQARATGELRDGISNEVAVEWIRNFHGLLQVRDDYDEAMQREMASLFLVPSLVRDEPIKLKRPAQKKA